MQKTSLVVNGFQQMAYQVGKSQRSHCIRAGIKVDINKLLRDGTNMANTSS
ncbi:MAG: hypothetical protein N838_03540 [Thiohalocapsa sp. PB-PSB1]|nr:MAG: hypothetical protein N838_03540 [Thiohalocapsa sp. PB-PSB1]